jgi:hypothetical protein
MQGSEATVLDGAIMSSNSWTFDEAGQIESGTGLLAGCGLHLTSPDHRGQSLRSLLSSRLSDRSCPKQPL